MNKLLAFFLLIALGNACYGGSEKPADSEIHLLHDHPFYSLFDNTGWDRELNGPIYFNRDGTVWVKEDTGRILFGVWHHNQAGNICVTLAGEIRGCYRVSSEREKVILADQQSDSEWTIEIRPGRPSTSLLSENQQKLLNKYLTAITVVDDGREKLYLHRDGAHHVVQEDGWMKTGGMWFRGTDLHCDNVNGFEDCIRIISVDDEKASKEWDSEEGTIAYEVKFDYNR